LRKAVRRAVRHNLAQPHNRNLRAYWCRQHPQKMRDQSPRHAEHAVAVVPYTENPDLLENLSASFFLEEGSRGRFQLQNLDFPLIFIDCQ
jgi:hypothetical protein